MTAQATVPDPVHRGTLMFALLGGGVAWFLHLAAAYLIAEFGCVSDARDVTLLGLTWIAWLILAMSIVMILVGLAATWASHVSYRRLSMAENERAEVNLLNNARYIAGTGLIMNPLFVLIIVAQSIPVFYYLRAC